MDAKIQSIGSLGDGTVTTGNGSIYVSEALGHCGITTEIRDRER
ncbi:MAG: hypothetical protein CFH41_00013 [Alphaproteobacteria bacterium MarineAlpha11_Bin1]|nr:MAG: hypothetical protein CFH41_00013 [Alphaproteobacteria bacterium MarineAlpha11_Bin1]